MRQVGHQRAGRACNRTLANAARPAIERGTDAPGGGSRKSTAPISGRHRRVATGPPEIGLTAGLSSNERVHFSAMRRTKRVSPRAHLLLKTRPKRGAPVRYGDRIAEVLGEARGEPAGIKPS